MKQRKRSNFHHQRFEDNHQQRSEPRGYGVLPAPGILESYEELAPGAVAKIIEMARLEQEQRHKWENNYLKHMAYITKIGQLLGFMLAAVITFAALSLGGDGQFAMAIFITLIGYGYLMVAAYISFSSRKILTKPGRKDEEKNNHYQQNQRTHRNPNYHRNQHRNRHQN